MTDFGRYAAALRESLEEQEEEDKEEGGKALEAARRCAGILAEKFGARRVYLFGSLAEGLYRKGSDVDLAVEGMDIRAYLKALAEFPVIDSVRIDLVHMDCCKMPLKERILQEGKVLYDSSGEGS